MQAQVLKFVKKLQKEMCLIHLFISHDLSVVRHMADVIAVMYLGRIVEIQPSADLFANPLHPYTHLLLETIPDLEKPRHDRSPMRGEVPSPVSPPLGCSCHPCCPLAFDLCKQERPQRLEEVHNRRIACIAAENERGNKSFYNEDFSRRAIKISAEAIEALGLEPFGAVIVKDGRSVSEGINRLRLNHDATSHGQTEAIRDISRNLQTIDLRGCDLYSSCEPCPLCVAAMNIAGIETLYFAADMAQAGAALGDLPEKARFPIE
jgi:oligopeptide/dipeptide ABC transporter ATP-binding protein